MRGDGARFQAVGPDCTVQEKMVTPMMVMCVVTSVCTKICHQATPHRPWAAQPPAGASCAVRNQHENASIRRVVTRQVGVFLVCIKPTCFKTG